MVTDIIYSLTFFLLLIILAPVTGTFIYNFAFERNLTGIRRKLFSMEKLIYRIGGINPEQEMNWKEYTSALLWFHLAGFILLMLIQLFQNYLPLNPNSLPGVPWHLALNTSVSFVTNTNWQSYSGETTLSYFTQMAGLTVQNFLSAATGTAVLFALIRSLVTRKGNKLGNFWIDLTRFTLFVLIPLSVLFAITMISGGVVQTLSTNLTLTTLEGHRQIIPLGPAASQIAIKQLGTNGGGFFGANSSFPFENPSPITNMLQLLAIVLIPAALVFTYGKIIGSAKHAWVIFSVMLTLLIAVFAVSAVSEMSYNPVTGMSGLMEGKETRFGVISSVLWSTATTAASSGSVNAMHSSLSPITGMMSMINIQLGEIIFGGVGSGLYGMILYIILTVFISGLMVGRSPEYLGKKIDAFDIKLAITGLILPGIVILIFTAISLTTNAGIAGLSSKGPHAFSEALYAFSSAAGNNGSAFAGLNANNLYYNLMLALAMFIGRFGVIIPVLAIAGNMVSKQITPSSQGTLRTDNLLFAIMLTLIILIVGALTFFPALTLGPIIEHLLMSAGTAL